MVGVVFDVTERKLAEQERIELAGRLINAQERERSHLARELHDDFSQKLAILSVELEKVTKVIDNSPAAIQRLLELRNLVNEIGVDLHSVSHRLHSSKLDILGLSRGVGSLCGKCAKQYGIQIDVDHLDVPQLVPPDTALCLFRVVQEGLHNVSKHSQASKVEVRLKGNGVAISLTLCDNGVGFEPSKNLSNGIGIQSMKERVRMLDGTFEVRSQPMQGTQIEVVVPLKSARTAA